MRLMHRSRLKRKGLLELRFDLGSQVRVAGAYGLGQREQRFGSGMKIRADRHDPKQRVAQALQHHVRVRMRSDVHSQLKVGGTSFPVGRKTSSLCTSRLIDHTCRKRYKRLHQGSEAIACRFPGSVVHPGRAMRHDRMIIGVESRAAGECTQCPRTCNDATEHGEGIVDIRLLEGCQDCRR